MTWVSGVSDDRVGQPEIENRDVVAAKRSYRLCPPRRENFARERSA
jgi:hypothetical protein